jgi:hypothetical protein
MKCIALAPLAGTVLLGWMNVQASPPVSSISHDLSVPNLAEDVVISQKDERIYSISVGEDPNTSLQYTLEGSTPDAVQDSVNDSALESIVRSESDPLEQVIEQTAQQIAELTLKPQARAHFGTAPVGPPDLPIPTFNPVPVLWKLEMNQNLNLFQSMSKGFAAMIQNIAALKEKIDEFWAFLFRVGAIQERQKQLAQTLESKHPGESSRETERCKQDLAEQLYRLGFRNKSALEMQIRTVLYLFHEVDRSILKFIRNRDELWNHISEGKTAGLEGKSLEIDGQSTRANELIQWRASLAEHWTLVLMQELKAILPLEDPL